VKGFLAAIQGAAVALGGPGLFIIAYLDSSFLSFPEVNDIMIIGMVMRHPQRLAYYALMSALGSVLGCLSIYYLARKGGEAFLRKRFKDHHVDRGLVLVQRYGLLAIIVPALLPPPAPFKIFVLLAGVAAIPAWQFATAIFAARIVRYGAEGLLAVWYGDRAFAFLHDHAMGAGMTLAGGGLVLGGAWIAWKRRAARQEHPAEADGVK
jgi:membrane protein YqaA with SNARE-associated domain